MRIKKSESCTEERILEAAKTVFIRKGFDGASMEDIAAEAKITRPSLNYYFRTKERIFVEIYKDIILKFLPLVEKVALSDKPIFERIEECVDIYTRVFLENPDVILFMASESSKDPERYFGIIKLFPEIAKSAKRIGREIKRNMKEGKLRDVPLEYFATTFFGLLFFPFLGRNIISGVFFKNNPDAFNDFMLKRRKFVSDTMKSIFTPLQK